MMVLSSEIPASRSSFWKFSGLAISRRTGSTRSVCQLKFTAPGICPRSYWPGLTLTSMMRRSGCSRCCSSQSVPTSTSWGPAWATCNRAAAASNPAPSHCLMIMLFSFSTIVGDRPPAAAARGGDLSAVSCSWREVDTPRSTASDLCPSVCDPADRARCVPGRCARSRSEEHTSELQSRPHLVCRLLLEKKKNRTFTHVFIVMKAEKLLCWLLYLPCVSAFIWCAVFFCIAYYCLIFLCLCSF